MINKFIDKLDHLIEILYQYGECRKLDLENKRDILTKIVKRETDILLLGVPEKMDTLGKIFSESVDTKVLFKNFKYAKEVHLTRSKESKIKFNFKNNIKASEKSAKKISKRLDKAGIKYHVSNNVITFDIPNMIIKKDKINENLKRLLVENEIIETIEIFTNKKDLVIDKVLWLPKISINYTISTIYNVFKNTTFRTVVASNKENNVIIVLDDVLENKKWAREKPENYFLISKDLEVKTYSEYHGLKSLLIKEDGVYRFDKKFRFDFENNDIYSKLKEKNREEIKIAKSIVEEIKECKITIFKPNKLQKTEYYSFLMSMSDLIKETDWEDESSVNRGIERLNKMVREFSGDMTLLMDDFARNNYKKIKNSKYKKISNNALFKLFLSMFGNIILSVSKIDKNLNNTKTIKIEDLSFMDYLIEYVNKDSIWHQ